MATYHDVPECDEAVLVNEEERLSAAGQAKPGARRLGMGLTVVGAICFVAYWSGLSMGGGAELATPMGRMAKLKRALISFQEDLKLTDHVSLHLGPSDSEGEPGGMSVKLTLSPKDDETPEPEPVCRTAFKHKEGKGDTMKKIIEDQIESMKGDMPEDSEPPTVTLEDGNLVVVTEKIPMSKNETEEVNEIDLVDDTIVFEMSTGRDLIEMIDDGKDDSVLTVHGGIKAKVEVSMMEKCQAALEEMVAGAAESEFGEEGQMVGMVAKLIRSFGLDVSFKYEKVQLNAVAASMGLPTFGQLLQLARQDLKEEGLDFFKKLADSGSADGLDHVSIKGLPKSPDYVLEFTNFHLTDLIVKLGEPTELASDPVDPVDSVEQGEAESVDSEEQGEADELEEASD